MEPRGDQWQKPGLKKYFCDLTLDPNTAHRNLKLCDNNKKVMYVNEEQSYPNHPHRFSHWSQVLCTNNLTGRCYWEVEWRGEVHIAVAYGGITRKGNSDDGRFGRTYQSWSLYCSESLGYFASHNYRSRAIPVHCSTVSRKVAVYVDCPAGTVSFYRMSSDTLTHLHTFIATFTEPVYAGFRAKTSDSSICLCALP